MESYSRANVTSMEIIATECQTVGESAIKMTTEKKIRLQEIPASTGNTTLVEKEATGLFIVWKIKENIKTMPSTTSL